MWPIGPGRRGEAFAAATRQREGFVSGADQCAGPGEVGEQEHPCPVSSSRQRLAAPYGIGEPLDDGVELRPARRER